MNDGKRLNMLACSAKLDIGRLTIGYRMQQLVSEFLFGSMAVSKHRYGGPCGSL
jgi:hypothetical protein